MANRTRAQYESTRLTRWILSDVGRELRLARTSAGLRQADVAARCGTSKSLLLAASQANRRAVAEAAPVAAGSFPLETKATMGALAEGRDPGADGIVFL